MMSPWPDELPGLGPGQVVPFGPCSICNPTAQHSTPGEPPKGWSWVMYGEKQFCLACARGEPPMMSDEPIRFVFTEEQLARAEAEGRRRQRVDEDKGLEGRNNAPSKGPISLEYNIRGATGELAVGLAFKYQDKYIYAEKVARRDSFDLPPNINVKATKRTLLVQLDDKPGKVYVYAPIDGHVALIHGWIHSKDAMRAEWIGEPQKDRPCYIVPMWALTPINDEFLRSIAPYQKKEGE